MKKIIILFLFFVTICSFAQTSNKSFDFEFYKNGEFRNSKNLKIQIIKNLDTIACEILNKKIIIPEIKDSCSVFIQIKNKKYISDKIPDRFYDEACYGNLYHAAVRENILNGIWNVLQQTHV